MAYALMILTVWLLVGFILGVVFGSVCRAGTYQKAKEPGTKPGSSNPSITQPNEERKAICPQS